MDKEGDNKYEAVNKKFLSDAIGEDSNISWFVSTGATYYDSEIAIRDCYKAVTIDFAIYSEDRQYANHLFKQKLAKLDTLIKELSDFREKYIEGFQTHLRNLEDLQKEKDSKGKSDESSH